MHVDKIDLDNLREHGKKLHQNIFDFPAQDEIIEHYLKANKTYEHLIKIDHLNTLTLESKKIKNLVHLEYFLRFKNSKNVLTQQKMILFYICELHPEYEFYFKSTNDVSFIKTMSLIVKYSFKSAFSLFLGWKQYTKIKGRLV